VARVARQRFTAACFARGSLTLREQNARSFGQLVGFGEGRGHGRDSMMSSVPARE
jgi:hypothetical protein